jgi:hypothetical protein
MLLFGIPVVFLLVSCGGGGDGGTSVTASSGNVSIKITDAKPMLAAGTQNVWITFEEVLVHKAGGSWVSLPLAQTPYTIDLLQFHSGNTTQLVPPVSLETGTYTQIRIVVSSATIRIDDGMTVTDYPGTIPSGNLKTDKDFSFVVQGGGAVDITIDFDLSKSIVVTGPAATPSYKLKPVLHINKTQEAATIRGEIANATFTFYTSSKAIVTVIWDKDLTGNLSPSDEEYTKVEVSSGDPAKFSIFWLVHQEGYTVQIDMDGTSPAGPEFQEFVHPVDLQPGDVFDLNSGDPF